MSPKPSLRGFLRKDILRNRIAASPLRDRTLSSPKQAPEEHHELDYLFEEDVAESKGYRETPESETNSLFGEPVGIVKEKSRGEERQEKLLRFLSDDNQAKAPASKVTGSPVLKEMRKELEELVMKEGEAIWEEKAGLRIQKRELIRKIAALESEEKGKKDKELKSTLDEISKTLPALGPSEEKTLKATAEKAYKAFAGLERIPCKRNRDNTGNDLDGEERLRMGKTYKGPAMKVTGHWGITLHDYFPDVEGKGGSIDRNTLTPEAKLLNRRELAKLGEALAKAKRKKKFLEEQN
ncbi:hypothetical protein BKA61DRAFT_733123 [Leptodontidium sp. MPI-SDFR-AT-0119]|nr:hypothetical protein BKA61DRAFT_733123 [Leptodontidium sp. MPI-SDFR-AT-0119]